MLRKVMICTTSRKVSHQRVSNEKNDGRGVSPVVFWREQEADITTKKRIS